MKQVKEFKYLGSIFTENGKLNREIETRIQKANNFSYQLIALLLKHRYIEMAKLINTMHHSNLDLPMPNVDLSKILKRKITSCEMCFLKRTVNKTRRDKIRNTKNKEMVGATPVHQRSIFTNRRSDGLDTY